MHPTLKPAMAADASRLISLMREYYAYDRIPFLDQIIGSALETLLADSRHGYAVFITVGGEEIGYVIVTYSFSVEFGGRFALIDEIFLRDGFRGKGIGQETIRFLLDRCSREGIGAVRLEVEMHNIAAQKFYEREGFTRHNRSLMTKWLVDSSLQRPTGKKPPAPDRSPPPAQP